MDCTNHRPKDASHCVTEHFGRHETCSPMTYSWALASIGFDNDWPTEDCGEMTRILCKALHTAECEPCHDKIEEQLVCDFMNPSNMDCGRLLCFDNTGNDSDDDDGGNNNSTGTSNNTTVPTSTPPIGTNSSVACADNGLTAGGKAGVAIFSIIVLLGFCGVITYFVTKRNNKRRRASAIKIKKANPFKTASSRGSSRGGVRNIRPTGQQLQHTIVFDDPHDSTDATETHPPSSPEVENEEILQGDVVDSSFQTVPIV